MKLLSDASEYALRAVVWLAQQPPGAYKVRQIAEATHAAPGYLVKVLQSLAREHVLSGQRGSHGGFTLIKDPARITVLEIINVVDPMERIHTCPLGFKSHGTQLCPMHRQIDDAMAAIEVSFNATTIHELIHSNATSRPLCNVQPMPQNQSQRPAENAI